MRSFVVVTTLSAAVAWVMGTTFKLSKSQKYVSPCGPRNRHSFDKQSLCGLRGNVPKQVSLDHSLAIKR